MPPSSETSSRPEMTDTAISLAVVSAGSAADFLCLTPVLAGNFLF